MVRLVRVDDRLIHGQVLCAWVPHVEARIIVLVSEEVPDPVFLAAFGRLCGDDELRFVVMKAADAANAAVSGAFDSENAIFIMNSILEAKLLYDSGYRYDEINIGNIHHNGEGRKISLAVSFDAEDERMLAELAEDGVSIDIRMLPGKEPLEYEIKGKRSN